MILIDVDDRDVQGALKVLISRAGLMQPILQAIGEDIMERAKARFNTGVGPDGRRWQGNAVSTIRALIDRGSQSKGFYLKDGKTLSKKAQNSLVRKKILLDTGSLASQFYVRADSSSVTVGNTMIYAAIHQFGGQTKAHDILPRNKKALAFGGGVFKKVRHPGSKIPARPFLPIQSNGSIYPQDRAMILDAINDYLLGFQKAETFTKLR